MRGFIVALILLVLIIGFTAIYGVYWRKEVAELNELVSNCMGEADSNTASSISFVLEKIEKKRFFWHLTLRQSKISALTDSLDNALYYCKHSNELEMNKHLTRSLSHLKEWQEAETLSMWTIL